MQISKAEERVEGQLLLLTIAKHALLSIICAASLLWISWRLVSSEPMKDPKYFDTLAESRSSRFFRVDGKYGLVIIYQAMPVIVVALLSFAVIELRKRIKSLQAASASGKGMVEVAGMLLYSYGRLTHLNFKEIEHRYLADTKLSLKTPMSISKLNRASENLGRATLIPFSLLWIPISRGSPILRLIKVPFEHAVKYHMWLAVMALTLLTGHSVGYNVYYYQTDGAYKIVKAQQCMKPPFTLTPFFPHLTDIKIRFKAKEFFPSDK